MYVVRLCNSQQKIEKKLFEVGCLVSCASAQVIVVPFYLALIASTFCDVNQAMAG